MRERDQIRPMKMQMREEKKMFNPSFAQVLTEKDIAQRLEQKLNNFLSQKLLS